MKNKNVLLLFAFLFGGYTAQGQDLLTKVSNNAQAIQSVMPREKIYLHTDKDVYTFGDTIWFKGYLIDALNQTPSMQSGIVYVDLIGEDKQSYTRLALHSVLGTSDGYIPIDYSWKNGRYMLRAFTNWMQNFGDSLFFQQEISLVGKRAEWLAIPQTITENNGKYALKYLLTNADGSPVSNAEVPFAILTAKGKSLLSGSVSTNADGVYQTSFSLKESMLKDSIFLQLTDQYKNVFFKRPLLLNRNLDVQFLPESGHLVAGFRNHIGIKSLGIDGMGVNVQGVIQDKNGKEVTSFQANHLGMGDVDFTPEAGQKYTAVLSSGQQYALQPVVTSGSLIQVRNDWNDDNVEVSVSFTPDLAGKTYYLIGQSKTFIILKAALTGGGTITKAIAKTDFPNGVAHFALVNDKGVLVNDRSFFVDNNTDLHLHMAVDAVSYHPHDSIGVDVTATDATNKPVVGSFSLAVTDTHQVDSIQRQNILSYLLLQSDVTGYVEQPAYYFRNKSPLVARALDDLLLTQGYVHYDWDIAKMKYEAEPEFQIKGKVTSAFGKGVSGAHITTYSSNKKGYDVLSGTSDSNGKFVIGNFPQFDTLRFVVDANRNSGIRAGLSVQLDRLSWPSANGVHFPPFEGVNAHSDSLLTTSLQMRNDYLLAYRRRTGNDLEDVVVRAKKGILHSYNLNGSGMADQLIDADAIRPFYGKSLYDVLLSTVKGFDIGVYPLYDASGRARRFRQTFQVGKNTQVLFLVDGMMPVYDKSGGGPGNEAYPIRMWLESIAASDVRGVEVLSSKRYADIYNRKFTSTEMLRAMVKGDVPPLVFIEITTYAGNGSYIHTVPGVEYLSPQPFFYSKTFYSPKYVAGVSNPLPNNQATIYWNSRVVTDAAGKAHIAFYAGDAATDYTFSLQGMDLNGNIGVAQKQLTIAP